MARVTSEGLNGIVGNIIFYIRDGKQYARSMPAAIVAMGRMG
jgi:hypothetical protein